MSVRKPVFDRMPTPVLLEWARKMAGECQKDGEPLTGELIVALVDRIESTTACIDRIADEASDLASKLVEGDE